MKDFSRRPGDPQRSAKPMRFWRISRPDYESDYKDSYVNGSLDHPYGLPGVKCDVCGATWGGSRILPFQCPESLRRHKNITSRWPISRHEHEQLQRELVTSLPIDGPPFVAFRPGDSFQPCFLDAPSRPRADFLWSSIGSLVVSERVSAALVRYWPDDVIACPVTLRKIGKRNAKLTPPIPSTGEPEDMLEEVPISRNVSEVGPYFEILIQKESGYPPGGIPDTACVGCGRANVNDSTRQLRMVSGMWRGDHVFFLATTLHVLVSDDVRNRLASMRLTNVRFLEVETTAH